MCVHLKGFSPCVKKPVRVFELVPMDLLDKAKEITMMSLSILYNTNPMPLIIYASPPPKELEQQGPDVKDEHQEEDTLIPTRKKKKGKKATCEVVIRKVNMRTSNGNVSIPKNFQFHAFGKRRILDDEQRSGDVSARPDICSMKHHKWPLLGGRMLLRMSMMTILV
jgi:hypothetical protein